MGRLTEYPPCRLFFALLVAPDGSVTDARQCIEDSFGALSVLHGPTDFAFTDYYSREMGSPLARYLALGGADFDPTCLADAKTLTNRWEVDLARPDGSRRVNFDPGLLSAASLILATTKARAHRVPLRDGIYAELTLLFHRGWVEALLWTYPDFRSSEYHSVLLDMRSGLGRSRN